MTTVQNKYIKKPQHVRQVLTEQINILRKITAKTADDKIKKAKAIAYLSSVALTAIREGDIEERLTAIEERMGE